MAFSANPLSLCVPEPAFESWLRDRGYLEIVDERSSEVHRVSSSSAAATAESTPAPITKGFVALVSFCFRILVSLLTINAFSKLAAEDFAGETPSWTIGFFGSSDSYSFPSSLSQARLRVHENVKRFARNYAYLFILFFTCALYQMPVALVGLISRLALWDAFKCSKDLWEFDRHPIIRQILVRIAHCATAVILFFSNVQMALFCALGISYLFTLLHASTRKLTPTKQPTRRK